MKMLTALKAVFDPRARLRRALGRQDLPTFPAKQMAVLRALRSPQTPLSTVGRQMASDPGLSTGVLRAVNSAAFGLGRKVSDPAHAATLLGRSELENLVLGIATRNALPKRERPGFEPERFWRTASRRAATARLLAEHLSPRDRGVCFTAALLQDMAIPLLADARPEVYGPLLQESAGTPRLQALEQEALGLDHTDIAGWLCETWAFPDRLAEAIRSHHAASAPADDAPLAVRISALIAHETEPDAFISDARALVDLAPDTLVRVLNDGAETGDAMARDMFR
jgi:HD-like signal output (HDOD) protein